MSEPQRFEAIGDIAAYRPHGRVFLDQAIELVTTAISAAREQNMPRLLVDLSQLQGFASPSVGARHFLARQWAGAAGGMHIAVLTAGEMIDAERFGVVVGKNFGANVNVFTAEAEALAWLRAQQ